MVTPRLVCQTFHFAVTCKLADFHWKGKVKTSTWTLEAKSRAYPPIIWHRGLGYPETFGGTWRRADGLRVDLEGTIDSDNGPMLTRVTTDPPMRPSEVSKLPLATMARLTMKAGLVFEMSAPGTLVQRTDTRNEIVIGPLRRREGNDPRLPRVADVYRGALRDGEPVTEAVMRELNVGESLAQKLIMKARAAGLLPPTVKGKKKG